jgi:hypothetical protein
VVMVRVMVMVRFNDHCRAASRTRFMMENANLHGGLANHHYSVCGNTHTGHVGTPGVLSPTRLSFEWRGF